MTCLLLSQPFLRLDIFHHLRASSLRLAATASETLTLIKTVSVGMNSCFSLGTSIFALSSSVKPSRRAEKELQSSDSKTLSFEFQLFCLCSNSLPDMDAPSGRPERAEPFHVLLTRYGPQEVRTCLQPLVLNSAGHFLTSRLQPRPLP